MESGYKAGKEHSHLQTLLDSHILERSPSLFYIKTSLPSALISWLGHILSVLFTVPSKGSPRWALLNSGGRLGGGKVGAWIPGAGGILLKGKNKIRKAQHDETEIGHWMIGPEALGQEDKVTHESMAEFRKKFLSLSGVIGYPPED